MECAKFSDEVVDLVSWGFSAIRSGKEYPFVNVVDGDFAFEGAIEL